LKAALDLQLTIFLFDWQAYKLLFAGVKTYFWLHKYNLKYQKSRVCSSLETNSMWLLFQNYGEKFDNID